MTMFEKPSVMLIRRGERSTSDFISVSNTDPVRLYLCHKALSRLTLKNCFTEKLMLLHRKDFLRKNNSPDESLQAHPTSQDQTDFSA
jgi:hypothetical protein